MIWRTNPLSECGAIDRSYPIVLVGSATSENPSGANDILKNIQSHDALAISVVTQLELMIGCRNKSELRKLDKFIKQIQIIKLNENISDKSVELLRLYRLSHGLLIADSLIAATALTLNLPFISKNQRD